MLNSFFLNEFMEKALHCFKKSAKNHLSFFKKMFIMNKIAIYDRNRSMYSFMIIKF